ncbi:hypothetical protein Tco_1427013, partial [Tanacetum coccineum]
MTRSSTKSKTSLAIAANLSELELKKILIDKMESNKSIHRSDEQKNLYKALVDAYESDKLILDTYGDTISFKRRRDDKDKDEEPSVGSNRGSKRRRARKEPELTSAPKEKTTNTSGKSHKGSKSQHKTTGESAQIESLYQHNEETPQFPDWFQRPTKLPSPDRDWNKTFLDAHGHVQPWLSSLAQKEDLIESFNDLMDTPLDFSAFVMNRLKLEYLFEEVYKETTKQLDWNNPEVEWHNYKHLDWINVHRDDDKLYKFKEGGFSRLRIHNIKDMLLLLVQGKLTNRTDEVHKFSDGTLNDVRTALDDRIKGIRM